MSLHDHELNIDKSITQISSTAKRKEEAVAGWNPLIPGIKLLSI